MSLLWKDNIKMQLLTIGKRPSSKHNNRFPCFAQSIIPYINKKFPNLFKICHSIEGISLFTFSHREVEASMTVEAAVVLPLFLFFFMHLGCAIEIIRLHGNLEMALWEVGNRLSVYGHVISEDERVEGDSPLVELGGIALSYTYVKGQIVDYLGEEYLEESPLKDGTAGLAFWESDIRESEDTFEVVLTYSVAPFIEVADFNAFRMANKYYGHFWNGYEIPTEFEEEGQYVYVAETGEVYHLNQGCTYLKLSIKKVSFVEALTSRNTNGEMYEMCSWCCMGVGPNNVYITNSGQCYHYLRECPGLKRTVYCILLSEAEDYRPCSRCGG